MIQVPFDDSGNLDGCVIIHGLFTFGLNQRSGIPILRRKLEAALDAEEVIVGGLLKVT